MATFGIHFDGSITIEHKVTIRVMAKTYEHMQRAIDRAYLIEVHGEVWKHARLKDRQYQETDFIAEYPQEGGIILEAVRNGAGAIIDRVADAIRPVFETALQRGLDQQQSIEAQLAERREYARQMRDNTPTYNHVAENPPPGWANAYSNRSVIKEVDQLVAQVTPTRLEGSTVEITLLGRRPHLPFQFDAPLARRFHQLVPDRKAEIAIQIKGLR